MGPGDLLGAPRSVLPQSISVRDGGVQRYHIHGAKELWLKVLCCVDLFKDVECVGGVHNV